MRILSRAFLSSYLLLFAAVLAASLLGIAIVEIMLHFDDIGARGGGLGAAAEWLRVRLPSYYLRDLIPITSFAAALLCLGLPARRLELRAALCGGLSPLRIALPVLGAAGGLSLLALLVNETLVLGASREWVRVESAAGADFFPRGSFWYHRDGVVYNVAASEPAARTLRDLRVYELAPEGRLLRHVRAERARVGPDRRWHLEGATGVRFDPASPAARPRLERPAPGVLEPGAGGADPVPAGHLSLGALAGLVDARAAAGRPAVRERALLHARLAEPLTVLAFAWLAVPLAFAVGPGRGLSFQLVRGGAALAAFYTARSLASLLALGGAPAAVPAPWLLLAGLSAAAAWHLARAR